MAELLACRAAWVRTSTQGAAPGLCAGLPRRGTGAVRPLLEFLPFRHEVIRSGGG